MKVKSFIKNFIIYFCFSFVVINAFSYLYHLIEPGAGVAKLPRAVTTSIILGIILPIVKRLEKPPDDSAQQKTKKGKLNKGGILVILGPFRMIIATAIIFFWAAGRVDIFRAWLYFGISFVGAVAGGLIMWKFAPELANHRASIKKGTKIWDKFFLAIFVPFSLFVFPAVAGLDVGRFKWSELGIPWLVLGMVLGLVKFILWHWAIVTNRHLEATVRIQVDRNHKVITDGPYRFVRHPGYLGIIIGAFSGSFIIGSLYSMIPASIIIVAIIIRTCLEDRTLNNELAGYSEYAKKTKYRLVPGVW